MIYLHSKDGVVPVTEKNPLYGFLKESVGETFTVSNSMLVTENIVVSAETYQKVMSDISLEAAKILSEQAEVEKPVEVKTDVVNLSHKTFTAGRELLQMELPKLSFTARGIVEKALENNPDVNLFTVESYRDDLSLISDSSGLVKFVVDYVN